MHVTCSVQGIGATVMKLSVHVTHDMHAGMLFGPSDLRPSATISKFGMPAAYAERVCAGICIGPLTFDLEAVTLTLKLL